MGRLALLTRTCSSLGCSLPLASSEALRPFRGCCLTECRGRGGGAIGQQGFPASSTPLTRTASAPLSVLQTIRSGVAIRS